MLTLQENMPLAHLLPINESYRSGTDIEGLTEGLPNLAHRLPGDPYRQSVYPIKYPNRCGDLCLGCHRDTGIRRLDLF